MGRTYWFECARCGYRAKVAGRADRGLDFFVQTIVCGECKQLYDAVTRLRVPDPRTDLPGKPTGLRRLKSLSHYPKHPPTFQAALNRLPHKGVRKFKWLHFPIQCPVSPLHRVESWNEPAACPRCGMALEKNALPYRIWD